MNETHGALGCNSLINNASRMALKNFRARSTERLHANLPLALVELLIAVSIIAGGLAGIIPFSSTPFLLLFGWLMLWLRGKGWRDVGLKRPTRWSHTLLIGVLVGIAYQFVSLYFIEPLLARLTGALPDVSQFAPLVGNKFFLVLSIIVSWTLAAFAEELAFRGYLLNRVADLAGGKRAAAWIVALVVTSTLFGLAHMYQGASGMLITGMSGLLFGALYLACGRNLWTAIIAHGVNDTVGFALIYLGKYPGL
jgi:membrane protease YdiL (CAAX protease family)